MAVEAADGDLLHVVVLLGAAVVAVPLFKRLGLGSILGYLAAGKEETSHADHCGKSASDVLSLHQ